MSCVKGRNSVCGSAQSAPVVSETSVPRSAHLDHLGFLANNFPVPIGKIVVEVGMLATHLDLEEQRAIGVFYKITAKLVPGDIEIVYTVSEILERHSLSGHRNTNGK